MSSLEITSNHRDLFNTLVSFSVDARLHSPDGGTRNHVDEFAGVITRENVSAFLWRAYRELEVGESMRWCGFSVMKGEGHSLRIDVLVPPGVREVFATVTISTRGKGFRVLKSQNKREGAFCARLQAAKGIMKQL